MTLTDQEYNFLMDLSARTKMDCWFDIETDTEGEDFVLDLENYETMPLHRGIEKLFENLIEDTIDAFESNELMLFNSLKEKIKKERKSQHKGIDK